MTRYYSFRELIFSFTNRTGTALEYAGDDDVILSISYPELASMITSYSGSVSPDKSPVDVIYTEHTPQCIARIFGSVIAGCDVVLADDSVTEETAREVKELALKSRAGRPGADGSEGEILFFTSGTTQRSKVVRLTSGSLCASAWSGQSMLPCGPDDRLLSVLPLSHVFGFVCSMLWGLAYGSVVCLGRGVRHIVDDPLFFRPTIIPAVPSLIGGMLRFGTVNPEARVCLIGAAPCTPEVTAALRARDIKVYLGYGLTETSSGIAITQDLDEPEAIYPCPGADICIEPDGEISVATPCMMKGYLGEPEMPERARFYTGDMGYFDDKGRLRLKGRKKDVLIMADGTKVYCPEYEERLGAASGSKDIAVVMKEGHAAVCISASEDADSVRRSVAEFNRTLPRSQQIYDVIIMDGPLPRTQTGKLKRYEIQEAIK